MIVLQRETPGDLGLEESYVESWAKLNGYEICYAPLSKLRKRRISLDNCMLAVGNIEFMSVALRLVGSDLPNDNCYPESVRYALGRDVKPVRLYEALTASERLPVFVKPRVRTKRFTGKVVHGGSDYWLASVPSKEPVWMVDEIKLVAEWRFYVKEGVVFHCAPYDGDDGVLPDASIVESVIQMLRQNEGYTDYAVDFGVNTHGRTLMIEFNDGYSLGAYGNILPASYSEMLLNRWIQMKESPSR